jgi:hypothetical protein
MCWQSLLFKLRVKPYLFALFPLSFLFVDPAKAADLRIGIVGTDTTHGTHFTRMLNDASAKDRVMGARIVAAFKGGSPDIENSRSRIERLTNEITGYGVPLVNNISDLCGRVDGILILSVDGRKHLEEVRQSLQCKVPLFIDKPLAATLADAREIARLADAAHVPWFSSSAMRFSPIQSLHVPQVKGAFVWGPGPLEEHHALDLSWYAIHPIEMLYVIMGTGAVEVTRMHSDDADVITARWSDGRVATVRAIRPYSKYGAIAFLPNEQSKMIPDLEVGYGPILAEIVKFVRTKAPPVPNEETLEIFSFMDAAQRSQAESGRPVRLEPR